MLRIGLRLISILILPVLVWPAAAQEFYIQIPAVCDSQLYAFNGSETPVYCQAAPQLFFNGVPFQGPVGWNSPSGQIGFSIGQSDVSGMFLNWVKSAQPVAFNPGASPASLDANGYPNVSSPAATMFNEFFNLPSLTQYGGTWEYGFSGTGARQVQGIGLTIVSDPNNCWQAVGQEIVGTNCDIIFNFQTDPSGGFGLQFIAGATYSGMTGEFLIRSTDKVAYSSGQILTPEFAAIVRNANPLFIRTMGLTFPQQGDENCGAWTYRTPAAANTWRGEVWDPALWSSSITGTDQYVASGASSTPVSWTDQEMLQGTFPNASNPIITVSGAASHGGLVQLTVNSTAALATGQQVLLLNGTNQSLGESTEGPNVYTVTVIDGTHVDLQGTTYSSEWNRSGGTITTTTINVAGRGAKFMVAVNGMSSPNIAAGDNGTMFYDAKLDLVLYALGGEHCGMPFEEQVELANEIGKPLWLNIPPFFRPADVTSMLSYAATHLRAPLYLELANENWNGSFSQFQYFFQNGYHMGQVLSASAALYSYIGLLTRLDYAAATTAWSSTGRSASNLLRINAGQAYLSPGQLPNSFENFQASGTTLCGTSCGNAAYQSAVGTDYNSAPNRPKDFNDAYSIATYWDGAQQAGNIGTLAQLSGIINAGAQFAAGNTTDAFAFVDADNRNGTCGGCQGEQFTIDAFQNLVAPFWNTIANNDGKSLIGYEGGYSSAGPTAAYLTSIGDSNASVDANNINNLEIAYRSSSQFSATYQFQNSTWFGNSRVIGNSNLQIRGTPISIGEEAWFVLQGGYFPAVPFQNYTAIQQANSR